MSMENQNRHGRSCRVNTKRPKDRSGKSAYEVGMAVWTLLERISEARKERAESLKQEHFEDARRCSEMIRVHKDKLREYPVCYVCFMPSPSFYSIRLVLEKWHSQNAHMRSRFPSSRVLLNFRLLPSLLRIGLAVPMPCSLICVLLVLYTHCY